MKKESFGKFKQQDVFKYTIENKKGSSCDVLNLGCIIQSVTILKDSKKTDVVLGYDNVEQYTGDDAYLGAIIGRYGNRIKNGEFKLDETSYKLAVNNGPNHLHGGLDGFNQKIFDVKEKDYNSLEFNYLSVDGEENYPGNLNVTFTLTLTEDNELILLYDATTDKKTILNLTNHSYFNLNGNGNVLSHKAQFNINAFCEGDENCLATGKIIPSANTVFDFSKEKVVGDFIKDDYLKPAGGFDHTLIIDSNDDLKFAGTIYGDFLNMEIHTTMPSFQFYTANALSERKGKNETYSKHSGLCIETQFYPDSPNNDHFPSTVLEPNEKYEHKTIYKFV